MVTIIDIGMNHETAPVEIRECFARENEITSRMLSYMRESELLHEGLFLSTCNRVEAIFTTRFPHDAKQEILSLFCTIGDITEKQIRSHLYIIENTFAVEHIFRVASSLDSLVVGEPQILGQIKQAYSQAVITEKTSGVILNRLMHRAFHVAKRVKTETGIGESAVSISYTAVELAKKIFYDLSGKKILLVGAGEMAELAARHLIKHGVTSFCVANRSFHRAVQVAESFGGTPVSFEEIDSQLVEADIVITSTGASDYVIHHDQVKTSLKKRRNRPLFFIDIAVPRNVDPAVNTIGNTYLYDIDDLKEVVNENTAQRKQEALKAERIVQEEVIRFDKWLKTLAVVPTIVSLKQKVESIRSAEILKSLPGLGELTTPQLEVIETLTRSLADKIINNSILVLKKKADRSKHDLYIEMTRELFNLDSDTSKEEN